MDMKKTNLVKKNFYFAMVVVVLLFVVGFAIAAYDSSKASHGTLYADRIEPKVAGTVVNVIGGLLVDGSPISVDSIDWSDIQNIPSGFADGIDNEGSGGGGSGGGMAFGDWQSTDIGQVGGTGSALNYNTIYQAKTDGILVIYKSSGGNGPTVKTDSNPNPTTIRAAHPTDSSGDQSAQLTIPIKKNDYWKIEDNSAPSIYWIPIVSGSGGGSGGGALYDSGWFAATNGGTYPLTHNLGTNVLEVQLLFSTDGGTTAISQVWEHRDHHSGGIIQDITNTMLTVQAGSSHAGYSLNSGGGNSYHQNGHYRVIATTGSGGGSGGSASGPTPMTVNLNTNYQISTTKGAYLYLTGGNGQEGFGVKLGSTSPPLTTVITAQHTDGSGNGARISATVYVPKGWYFRLEPSHGSPAITAYYVMV